MGYLSLYKTLTEHGADNSRLTPNISLITDENRLILTTKNNLNMTFNNINVVETTDEMTNNIILNKFPSITLTGMPGLKIYTDNTSQSKAENVKLYNAAQQFRNNYIIYWGWSDTSKYVYMVIDSLILNNKTIDEYDRHYNYSIHIYNNRIVLHAIGGSDVLTIYGDGSVSGETPDYTGTPNYTGTPDYTEMPDIDTTSTTSTFPVNIFPDSGYTAMPILKIYSDNDSKSENIKLYNDAQEWRDNFILNSGSSDTGQGYGIRVDGLIIYNTIWDEYDGNYNYGIYIYNDHIILYGYSSEILTILSDGSVIFNEFPTNDSTHMPVINIYTDNTSQSKANNIELYNNAQEWRSNYISDNGLSDTGQAIFMYADALIIDEVNIDKYDQNFYYFIDIYKDHIILIDRDNQQEILTISGDGSVSNINLPTTPPQLPDIDTTSTTTTSNLPPLTAFNIFQTPTNTATIMPV